MANWVSVGNMLDPSNHVAMWRNTQVMRGYHIHTERGVSPQLIWSSDYEFSGSSSSLVPQMQQLSMDKSTATASVCNASGYWCFMIRTNHQGSTNGKGTHPWLDISCLMMVQDASGCLWFSDREQPKTKQSQADIPIISSHDSTWHHYRWLIML